jgi:hypothetical protein
MFDGETADCLALANTAILMRLIEELSQRGVISKPSASALLRNAVSDLENCPESSSRVEDAIRDHPQGTDAENWGHRPRWLDEHCILAAHPL